MPLIVMVGIPCSGKSTRARQLSEYLTEEHKADVVIVNEEFLELSKQEYLANPQQEKILRASLKSNVEKHIGGEKRVVILDSMNYIKGFRYELYCLARNAKSTLCVVFCDSDPEICQKLAAEGGYENAFPADLFTDYAGRLERPNPAQRWDKPCFQLRFDEETPLEDIAKACFLGKKPRDPVSTKPEELFDADFVFQLDKACQAVIAFIGQEQAQVSIGDSLGIPNCKRKYQVVRIISPMELKKLKKDFLNLSKLHPPKQKENFGDVFLDFLNTRIVEE